MVGDPGQLLPFGVDRTRWSSDLIQYKGSFLCSDLLVRREEQFWVSHLPWMVLNKG